jgi:GT2 family glycosyltransferase
LPAFQRLDLDGESTQRIISDKEMKRRWAAFHGQMRQLSGKRWQRVLGRILGENTWRYKFARTIGRPPLRALRKMRARPHRAEAVFLDVPLVHKETEVFPKYYSPKSALRFVNLSLLEVSLDDVEVVTIDEETSSAAAVVAQLNEAYLATTKTWLMICDETTSDLDRTTTLRALKSAASESDDVVFADENGPNIFQPIFRSACVSPHTLLSYNIVGRPALLRISTLRRAGGFLSGAGWAFEHDSYLRFQEGGAQFHHVALVLPAGRPLIAFERHHIDEDSCRVVRAALERRGLTGTVEPGALAGLVHWTVEPPTPRPSIDIIIPTRDRIDLVRRCIEAIEGKTTYENYDIILLDNDSVETDSLEYFATTKYRVIACPGPFNYAKIVNRGVAHSSADFIVTLNNDTILMTNDWLERMVSLAAMPDVGIVGACLLDQFGHKEHESIVISPYPQHLRTDSNYPHVDHFALAVRDVAAVTGAVQMASRDFWNSLGGMDERLAVTMNDIDLCLRSQSDARFVVYMPDVAFIHYVSSSRGTLDPLADRNRFIRRWDIFGTFRDPFFPEPLLLLGETMYYLPR